MFTSSALAPPRTCSSATSTAPAKSPASTRRRKRDEPVTFVRSPIRTKPVSGPISNGSSPLQRVAARRRPAGRAARARAWPRRSRPCARGPSRSSFRRRSGGPPAANSREERARHLGRLVVAAEGVREPGVRVRADEARRGVREVGDVRAHLVRAERAVDPDDQRVGVLDRGPERLDRLAGERAAGAVDDRGRDPERQLAAPSRAPPRSPPSRSACRRSSRAGAGRRRPRRAPPSARRRPP